MFLNEQFWDFQKDAQSVTVASLRNYEVLQPIPAARLDELQEEIGALLDKFKKLPLGKDSKRRQ